MIVMGIDPGSRNTGYGVISSVDGGFTVLSCGVIRLKSSQSLPERIGEIYTGLEQLMTLVRPDCVAIETAFVGRNVRSALALGQVRGAVLALAVRMGTMVREYAPREVKLAVTGSGSAAKEQVSFMLSRLLGIGEMAAPNDASDALGVAFCDLMRNGAGGCRQNDLFVKGRKKTKQGWSAFLADHPDLVA